MRLEGKIAIVIGAGQSPGEGMGNGRATVHWTAPAGNRERIIGYIVTPYTGWSTHALASRVFNSQRTTEAITGLKNGKTYRFKVAAKYANGTGPTSIATNLVRVGPPTG